MTLKDKIDAARSASVSHAGTSARLADLTAQRSAAKDADDAASVADANATADLSATLPEGSAFAVDASTVVAKIDGAAVFLPVIDPASVTLPDPTAPADPSA